VRFRDLAIGDFFTFDLGAATMKEQPMEKVEDNGYRHYDGRILQPSKKDAEVTPWSTQSPATSPTTSQS
jgi:hypothetical protein